MPAAVQPGRVHSPARQSARSLPQPAAGRAHGCTRRQRHQRVTIRQGHARRAGPATPTLGCAQSATSLRHGGRHGAHGLSIRRASRPRRSLRSLPPQRLRRLLRAPPQRGGLRGVLAGPPLMLRLRLRGGAAPLATLRMRCFAPCTGRATGRPSCARDWRARAARVTPRAPALASSWGGHRPPANPPAPRGRSGLAGGNQRANGPQPSRLTPSTHHARWHAACHSPAALLAGGPSHRYGLRAPVRAAPAVLPPARGLRSCPPARTQQPRQRGTSRPALGGMCSGPSVARHHAPGQAGALAPPAALRLPSASLRTPPRGVCRPHGPATVKPSREAARPEAGQGA